MVGKRELISQLARAESALETARGQARVWRGRALEAEESARNSARRAAQLEGWVESLTSQVKSYSLDPIKLTEAVGEVIRGVLMPGPVQETDLPPLEETGESGMFIPEWEGEEFTSATLYSNPISSIPGVDNNVVS